MIVDVKPKTYQIFSLHSSRTRQTTVAIFMKMELGTFAVGMLMEPSMLDLMTRKLSLLKKNQIAGHSTLTVYSHDSRQ